jgi:hypothetical protein
MQMDARQMTMKVKYLSEAQIEDQAEALLSEYEETIEEPIKLPVPVADITTYHLALRLGFDDLHQLFDKPLLRGEPDILGAIWVEKRLVLIDRFLDPEIKPSMLGRYRFSVAHEIGHWRLHRSYVARDPDQSLLFDTPSEPTVICRSSQEKERIEWQANFFASCLLMPRRLVHEVWSDCMNRTRPLLLSDLPSHLNAIPREQPVNEVQQRVDIGSSANVLFDGVARPIAHRFDVSATAMRIRLEKLGLLLRQEPNQMVLGIMS